MKFEFIIANRIKSNRAGNSNDTPSLNVAIIGMTLAIVIMLLSVMIVEGFKNEITEKLYSLDSHIKIKSVEYNPKLNYSLKIDSTIISKIRETNNIKDISVFVEKSVVLKTEKDFKGGYFKGVDKSYNWDYLSSNIIDGKIPDLTTTSNSIIISKTTADALKIKVGEKIRAYFINDNIKVRNLIISGIYKTDIEDFDNNYIIGGIDIIRNVCGMSSNECSYIGINCCDKSLIDNTTLSMNNLVNSLHTTDNYYVTNTKILNSTYFTWLHLLDMNVIIIIIIMLIVTSFTLIAGMLMIVLEKVNMIGILKSLGATNNSISRIFIYVTNKLILKSLIIGNTIVLIIAYLQNKYHLITLDAEAYYMSYVPIDINWIHLFVLNIGIIIISYLTLLMPARIISTIHPSRSVKF
ncbi:MAG: ABC transporter permease [Bacteroidales bacterium]|nr:ABC transporter permease [Bacteroidales bacterium]